MSASKKIGAFFDFDGTLLKADSESLLIERLRKAGELSIPYNFKLSIMSIFYKLQIVSIESLQKVAMQFYKGQSIEKFENIAEAFYFSDLKPLLSNKTVRKLKEHQQQDHVVVLLSASVRYYLNYVVNDFGIEHLLCTDLEVGKDGLLTGLPQGKSYIGPQKAVAAKQLASRLGIDLNHSYAYGDHISDLPILQLVGHPVAVEPIPQLKKVANQKNWTILQF